MNDNGMEAEYEVEMDDDLQTVLDEVTQEELEELLGRQVLGLEMWEESLGDEEDAEPIASEERVLFDCDLFLDDGTALELYATLAYPDPEGDPIQGMDKIFDVVGRLADEHLELLDYDQADEEGGLALAFGKGEQVEIVMVASAWMISEWEPEEFDEEEDEVSV
ncbi:MAG: hypothetical protein CVU38_10140 [Chloroflexi bacterium HGW-Chloroflexi-1]|nr:MAG: hypothetical protein CVU38_10140 [Chloroflexi bacterium HGW-Chloroflexi-1]